MYRHLCSNFQPLSSDFLLELLEFSPNACCSSSGGGNRGGKLNRRRSLSPAKLDFPAGHTCDCKVTFGDISETVSFELGDELLLH